MGYVAFYIYMLGLAVIILGGWTLYKNCKAACKRCKEIYKEEFGE